MKLYDMQMAPNPRRVRVFLAEKGINNVQLVPVDIAKREHKSDDYIANINRMGQVPTLELDDGIHNSESMAISGYSKKFSRNRPCLAATPRKRHKWRCGAAVRNRTS